MYYVMQRALFWFIENDKKINKIETKRTQNNYIIWMIFFCCIFLRIFCKPKKRRELLEYGSFTFILIVLNIGPLFLSFFFWFYFIFTNKQKLISIIFLSLLQQIVGVFFCCSCFCYISRFQSNQVSSNCKFLHTTK